MIEHLEATGTLHLRLIRPGQPTAELRCRNLIVGTARDALAATLMGVPFGAALSHIHFGSSTAAPTLGDTAPSLVGPLLRKPLRKVWMPAPGMVQADFVLVAGEFPGAAITEFALLRDQGDETYALFSRVVRPAIHLSASLQIEGTWVIDFNPTK